MDDTKKLIEKYKRELMELSRRSAKPAPVTVVEDETVETAEVVSAPTETEKAESKREPKIIGYVSEESGEFPAVYDRFLAEIIDNDESIAPQDIDEKPVEADAPPVTAAAEAPQNDTDDVVDVSDVLFTPPKYADIPSTQQVREEITEQSNPDENYPTENVSGVTDNSSSGPPQPFAPAESVSAEKAETLADQPISGQDENEQLTGRSFEDESYPQNPEASPDSIMRQGSGAQPVNYPPPEYDTYEEFLESNTGRGTILFRVYTAQEALPIPGAKCVISKQFGGDVRELCALITDRSGQTRTETLPAPSKELSQSYSNSVQPFAVYDATVSKPDYADVELKNIPVFDGVQSIQRVSMIPATPGSGATEKITEVDNAR